MTVHKPINSCKAGAVADFEQSVGVYWNKLLAIAVASGPASPPPPSSGWAEQHGKQWKNWLLTWTVHINR